MRLSETGWLYVLNVIKLFTKSTGEKVGRLLGNTTNLRRKLSQTLI